jgi:hypothetical protein
MPNSPGAQGMLARTIHGLLDQHLDQEIERAIATAPDISVARFIRRESEAACESVDVTTHGMVLRSRLFCVAILAEFPRARDGKLSGRRRLLARACELSRLTSIRSNSCNFFISAHRGCCARLVGAVRS